MMGALSRVRSGRLATAAMAFAAMAVAVTAQQPATPGRGVQFVFTSDAHYGLTRTAFRGARHVDAHVVNAALVARINQLPTVRFPRDGGLRAGEVIGPIDFVAEGGDIVNREEVLDGSPIQPAAASWRQFIADYVDGMHVDDTGGRKTPVLMVPGNHDVSNAVGFYKPMLPSIDKTAVVEIFNRMTLPQVPRTTSTYNVMTDRTFYTRDFGGVHFIFLTIWPDSDMRRRMERDLARVSSATPVVLVTHDQPDVEAKHLRNPNGAHDINAHDQFENLLADTLEDGTTTASPTLREQAQFEAFVHQHPNVVAYFHGNSNWNQFYDWNGLGHTISLHTFRVDSPMKGATSAADETKLSFQVATINATGMMTVRECLWNPDPAHPNAPVRWGAVSTVSLRHIHSTD